MTSSEEKHKMLQKLSSAKLGISILFGNTNITLRDFLDLKEGDVVRLDNSVEDNLIVCVNKEKKFFGRPGMVKNKLAVRVVDSYYEKDDIM